MFFKKSHALDKLFNPKSVAVIGASADRSKLGFILVDNLLQGARRKIYPINPTTAKIAGLRCYSTVLNIKASIDLAIIAVPASIVLQTLTECGQKQIPYVVIISAGFKEQGANGLALENEVKKIAKQYHIKIIGPNCLGLIDAQTRLNASFVASAPLAGSIAFLSQSGAICSAILDWSLKENIGFSKFVSLGNEAGLTENDFLDYLAQDKATKAILLYLEAVSDGRRFIDTLKRIAPYKPVVVLKAGRSARGSRAVSSHTGSLASAEAVFRSACQQGGAIYVTDMRALFNITKLFNAGIYRSLDNLCIVTNGGGPSIVMSDLIELSPRLNLVNISESLKMKLRAVLPATAALGNPIDLIGDAPAKRYEQALKIISVQPEIDAVIAILTPQKMTESEATAKMIVKYAKRKPILPMFIGEASTARAEAILKKAKIGNYEYPGDIQEILEAMTVKPKPPSLKPVLQAKSNRRLMDAGEAIKILNDFELNVSGQIVKRLSDLPRAWSDLKAPLAMKVISADVIHKSDSGAVMLNLNSLSELDRAWRQISANVLAKNPQAKIDGMMVQSMSQGQELIIGMKRDANFGPTIIFGLGGIMVEILNDLALRVAPVNQVNALAMINEIKGSAILKGARGQAKVKLSDLVTIIVNLSQLALAHPEIQEIDLNPVMVNEAGASIVDLRIII